MTNDLNSDTVINTRYERETMNQVNETFKPLLDAICPPANSEVGKIETDEYNIYAQHMRIIQYCRDLEEHNTELRCAARKLLDILGNGVELKCLTPVMEAVIQELSDVVDNLHGTTGEQI